MPETSADWLRVGSEHAGREEWPQALEAGSKALELDRENLATIKMVCQWFRKAGDPGREAETALSSAALLPGNAEVQRMAAAAAIRVRLFREAVAPAQRAVLLEPQNIESLTLLANAQFDAGDAGASVETLGLAIAVDSNVQRDCMLLATALQKQRRWREALEILDRTDALGARGPAVLRQRSALLWYLKDEEGAMAAAEQAVVLAPDAQSFMYLARAAIRLDPARALQAAQEALRLAPTDQRIPPLLAQAEAALAAMKPSGESNAAPAAPAPAAPAPAAPAPAAPKSPQSAKELKPATDEKAPDRRKLKRLNRKKGATSAAR